MVSPIAQILYTTIRQFGKPLSTRIIKYSKNHPFLRNRVLIPIGQGLHWLKVRAQFKDMGMAWPPEKVQPLKEESALQLTEDFMQEGLPLVYTIIALMCWITYSQYTSVPTAKLEDFNKLRQQVNELNDRVIRIESTTKQSSTTNTSTQQQSSSSSDSSKSAPIDSAVRIVIGKQVFLVTKRDSGIRIEPWRSVIERHRGQPIVFRHHDRVDATPTPTVDNLLLNSAYIARDLIVPFANHHS